MTACIRACSLGLRAHHLAANLHGYYGRLTPACLAHLGACTRLATLELQACRLAAGATFEQLGGCVAWLTALERAHLQVCDAGGCTPDGAGWAAVCKALARLQAHGIAHESCAPGGWCSCTSGGGGAADQAARLQVLRRECRQRGGHVQSEAPAAALGCERQPRCHGSSQSARDELQLLCSLLHSFTHHSSSLLPAAAACCSAGVLSASPPGTAPSYAASRCCSNRSYRSISGARRARSPASCCSYTRQRAMDDVYSGSRTCSAGQASASRRHDKSSCSSSMLRKPACIACIQR